MNRKKTGSMLLALIAMTLGTTALAQQGPFGPRGNGPAQAQLTGPVSCTMTVNMNDKLKISDTMFGIFFEDINYGADGGLYAELVANRDFECTPADARGWSSKKF